MLFNCNNRSLLPWRYSRLNVASLVVGFFAARLTVKYKFALRTPCGPARFSAASNRPLVTNEATVVYVMYLYVWAPHPNHLQIC